MEGNLHLCKDHKVRSGDFLSGITSQRRASSLVLAVIDLTDTACRELLASKEIQKVSFGKTAESCPTLAVLFSRSDPPGKSVSQRLVCLLRPEDPHKVPDPVSGQQ